MSDNSDNGTSFADEVLDVFKAVLPDYLQYKTANNPDVLWAKNGYPYGYPPVTNNAANLSASRALYGAGTASALLTPAMLLLGVGLIGLLIYKLVK